MDIPILNGLLESKRISAFSVEKGAPWVLARVKEGETSDQALTNTISEISASGYTGPVFGSSVYPDFHLLSTEFRPGSGIIRKVDGSPKGPAGGLTCFLSSRSGDELYFLGAAHVLTNYWRGLIHGKDRRGSIYRNIKGFPDSESRLFAGKLFKSSKLPPPLKDTPAVKENEADYGHVTLDAGIARLEPGFIIRQRTTCYGSFHDLHPPGCPEVRPHEGTIVIKCGPEEPHETSARVVKPYTTAAVIGPKGERYRFSGQILLGPLTKEERANSKKDECIKDVEQSVGAPLGGSGSLDDFAFAAAGDSGTMVVDKETKTPIGMLIAGSILSGMYLVTPIGALKEFWEKDELIFRRG